MVRVSRVNPLLSPASENSLFVLFFLLYLACLVLPTKKNDWRMQ